MSRKIYSVWNNKTDQFVVQGDAHECAAAMGIKDASFASLLSRCRNGKNGKWTIREEPQEKQQFQQVCEDCGKVFRGGKYAYFCPQCRKNRLSKNAKTRNLNRIGMERRKNAKQIHQR